jgi:hypothetical protein
MCLFAAVVCAGDGFSLLGCTHTLWPLAAGPVWETPHVLDIG